MPPVIVIVPVKSSLPKKSPACGSIGSVNTLVCTVTLANNESFPRPYNLKEPSKKRSGNTGIVRSSYPVTTPPVKVNGDEEVMAICCMILTIVADTGEIVKGPVACIMNGKFVLACECACDRDASGVMSILCLSTSSLVHEHKQMPSDIKIAGIDFIIVNWY